jgi:uncharacterized membrane protein YfcA
MSYALPVAASFLGAALSALGMGGGGVFLIYLTAYLGLPQLQAQGMNLVFFVPVALVAIAIHVKNKLIHWKIVLPCVLAGLPGVWLGAWLAAAAPQPVLGKLFAVFLGVIGLRELFAKKNQK